MGMAASQARLITLTSRKNHIGYDLTMLSAQKMSLARESDKIATAYSDALNKKRLKWSNDAGATTHDLTYKTLMNPSQLNAYEPYMLTDHAGKVVVDDFYHKYAKMISPNGAPGGNYEINRTKILAEILGVSEAELNASLEHTNRLERLRKELAALEEESLLDLARFRYPDVLPNTHYRSKYEELIDFSNYAFYKGRLFVAPNTDKPEKPPIEVHQVQDAVWQGRANRKEAERVVELIKEFFATRQNNETIGVIAFNVSQRDMIYDVIDEESVKDPKFGSTVRAEMARKDNGEDTGFFVKNIESVQGDERDVIMFSIGYAKNTSGRLIHNFGWLNQKGGENRLNVAISRAKKKIHIVTSFRPAELMLDDAKNDGPRILKRYLEYAFAVSRKDHEEAEMILRSFGETYGIVAAPLETEFAMRVADALREKGYDIDTQVGIGGYRIDVAVRKGGKYVLGIECDGKLYSVASSARERDYHRQKYLESRGWKIKRIWSMDWWRDPQREIYNICEIVDKL